MQWEDEIAEILLDLGEDPYRGDLLTGSLCGVRSLHFSLKRSGAFRAAYVVLEDQCLCLVFMISSRENFYQEAARRYAALQRR